MIVLWKLAVSCVMTSAFWSKAEVTISSSQTDKQEKAWCGKICSAWLLGFSLINLFYVPVILFKSHFYWWMGWHLCSSLRVCELNWPNLVAPKRISLVRVIPAQTFHENEIWLFRRGIIHLDVVLFWAKYSRLIFVFADTHKRSSYMSPVSLLISW